MEPQEGNGPDGSSLKPVSSLRAQFENMGKTTTKADTSAPPPTVPPPRHRSPSPKPPPIPSTRPVRNTTVVALQDEARPKPREGLRPAGLHIPETGGDLDSAVRSPRIGVAPPLSPKPVKPPSVLIEPPQSPPKGWVTNLTENQHNQLNLDPTKAPLTPTAPSSRPFKISSRPHTPVLEPRRSPRLAASSQPPSPPPPRRSGELRRDRELKGPAPVVPPPINRAEKPSNRLSYLGDHGRLDVQNQVAERSPFNSPPTSASDPEQEEPPELPTRPVRPAAATKAIGSSRTSTLPAPFEPPPVRHSLITKRPVADLNGHARGPPVLKAAPEPPPPPVLPSRPHVATEPPPTRTTANPPMPPPPRPPRIGIVTANVNTDAASSSAQPKRVVSTPTQQFAPPPARGHGRSMTVDRTSDRTPAEFRETPRKMFTVVDRTGRVPESQPSGPAVLSSQVNAAYPDASNTNRRPPFIKKGVHEIYTKYDTRIFDVCGQYVCTSGHLTRVWNLLDGELLVSFAHGEGLRATAVAFKCGLDVHDEGSRLWIGDNSGELMEADIATQSVVGNKSNAHGRNEVIKIYRHLNEMWTLDDGGTLHVWGSDAEGSPNLSNPPHQTYRLPRTHSFSMIVNDELWHASGKEIRVFAPTVNGRAQVQVLVRPMIAEGAGEITSGTQVKSQPGIVFFGHIDGKVSMWAEKDFSCLGILNISTYKINSLAGVGNHMWAAYNTGKICVYDIETSPWVVKKEWQAHDNPALKLMTDRASFYRLDRLQVISLGADNMLRSWDGLLQDDFLENEMKARDAQYSEFEDIKALVMTWNAGASTPSSLRRDEQDAAFIQNLLQTSDCPDILIFGFQELVDLEDKTATAKRLFKSKKKKDNVTAQERMSHQYRDWRDFLVRSLDDYFPGDCLYHPLHSSTLVGLFTCIFVKASLRDRIRNLSSAEIKRGMGGFHGNKGAIVVRFMVDDTSLCLINCHLAAGQSNANARHNDIAAIMDSTILPVEKDPSVRIDSYMGGGDGTMILDHELCLLNGDLNYRIDTMSRDTVVSAVKVNNLSKLLERDQLLVARRRNPAFKLRAFDEMPIQFAPTYKYDVGTDTYDSSEKKRSPAWCDRLLHRGNGRIQQLDYRRHEVRVSDHRPVTGRFKFTIKRISPKKRALTWADCQQRFDNLKEREASEDKLDYLMNVIGYDSATSKGLIREKSARRPSRSPSRRLE
ncbi:Endonuclease/exonuclease/phosphatase [Pseudomassariella vexata]|uniref:Endonuclease/exonuclease/phosphatase n=1 Tax=Pseudomassariella vexata TaxID=1141098 RepID=A0A1Y2EJZ7_9PEZI|nr:Endonuclease/exonuclease/phosphatase [Pseudomassariella vexata]ORY71883.1 Endonuclease/exonuclease/phosphatase [Pseudomassariella vexata]